jgi:hypothetical protein
MYGVSVLIISEHQRQAKQHRLAGLLLRGVGVPPRDFSTAAAKESRATTIWIDGPVASWALGGSPAPLLRRDSSTYWPREGSRSKVAGSGRPAVSRFLRGVQAGQCTWAGRWKERRWCVMWRRGVSWAAVLLGPQPKPCMRILWGFAKGLWGRQAGSLLGVASSVALRATHAEPHSWRMGQSAPTNSFFFCSRVKTVATNHGVNYRAAAGASNHGFVTKSNPWDCCRDSL